MAKIEADTVFRPQENVLSTRLDEETILLDLKTGTYFGLNDTGFRIWSLLDGRRDVRSVWSAIAEEFDIPVEDAGRETRMFLAALGRLKLIEQA